MDSTPKFSGADIAAMDDSELSTELARLVGIAELPTMRGVIERLRSVLSVPASVEPFIDEDAGDDKSEARVYRVIIKPPAWRVISVVDKSKSRAVRTALLLWGRNDPSAPAVIRRSLNLQ